VATGWEPLRRPVFRSLWIAAVASNRQIGCRTSARRARRVV